MVFSASLLIKGTYNWHSYNTGSRATYPVSIWPLERKTMDSTRDDLKDPWDPEPRWPGFIAVLAVGGLYLALPHYLTIGPRWLFPICVVALLIPTLITHRAGKHHLDRILGFTVSGLVTFGMIASVTLLISALPSHRQSPTELLLSAAALWFTNVL